jgi:AraC-like DNA-binding protein
MTMSPCQFLSPTRQAAVAALESAPRPLVGYAADYPAGLETGLHAHPRAQLLYAISGVMRIATPEAAYLVPPSTALFLPADVQHTVRMDGPVCMRELFLRNDAVARVGEAVRVITVSPLLREVILAACAEPLQWDTRGRGKHLTELALDEIARASDLPLRLPMPQDRRLQRVVAAVLSAPQSDRSLEDLAAAAGASSRTLARLFRTETGLSFRQWRQQARMAEAVKALTRGTSLAKAAATAGYASVPAFGATFRAVFGMTPRQMQRIGKS